MRILQMPWYQLSESRWYYDDVYWCATKRTTSDVLSNENAAIEESRASIIHSATESHVQGDLEGLQQICNDLQSKMSSLNQMAENRKNEAHATDKAVHQQNHTT